MGAEEGRDYELLWPTGCRDHGEHDVYETHTFASYLPDASCMRCGATATTIPLQPAD